MNLYLGGSRNFTHQYKGVETASGGNLALVVTHPAWIYYFLGSCTVANINDTTHADNTGVSNYHTASVSDGIFIEDTAHLNQGPIFYRSVGTKVVPPLMPSDAAGSMDSVTRPDAATKLIDYTFAETEGDTLPSFALEQSITKNASTNTYLTGTDTKEDNAFVRIARGNMVNTLTLTANENEEVKMTLDLNSRTLSQPPTDAVYEARNGQTTNTSLFNYNTAQESFNEPYFFSSGSLSIFGHDFLKVTNFSLTMNNNLQDKRFVGVGNKSIKNAIPAQRTYEIAFTAMITDNHLFNELMSDTDTAESSNSNIVLTFTKQGNSNETFTMTFKDYLMSAANVTIPEDKGPVTIEATLMPRTCVSVTASTNWVLMG
jgi:hypothetical protein